jgi:TonB-linked SusC/RagA family outer membrane protein
MGGDVGSEETRATEIAMLEATKKSSFAAFLAGAVLSAIFTVPSAAAPTASARLFRALRAVQAESFVASRAMARQNDSTTILERRAGLSVREASLESALGELHRVTGLPLLFSPSVLPSQRVTCECENASVEDALRRLLAGAGLSFSLREGQIVIAPAEPAPRVTAPQLSSLPVVRRPIGILGRTVLRPGPLQPMQVAAITGVVRDQATGSPISAVQVFIPGLDVGVLSQSDGRYVIQNVPQGTHTVTAERIGYRTVTHEVTVAGAQTVVQDFALSTQALQLDEIVVTGTGTGARVREIGNAVGQIDATIAETEPIANVSDLLRGRVTGVTIQQGSGAAGSASAIKIRGSSTMRLVNDGPLIYIDGVRVSNVMQSGPTDVSRIDDLDPAMIQSIEIIKGPAAATLYGTEAANGVIQIITRNGAVGEDRWNFTVRQGASWFSDPAGRTPTNWGVNPLTGQVETLNIMENEAERDAMFRTGRNQYYGLDVSGGTSAFQYFVAGSASSDEGATYNSWVKKYNGRVNVTTQPSTELRIEANAGVALTRLRLPSDFPYDDAVYATPENLGDARRGYRTAPPEARYEQDHDYLDANRVTAGVTLSHTPTDWLSQRLTFGLDVTAQKQTALNVFLSPQSAQFFSARSASGSKTETRESQFFTTFDYSISATKSLWENLVATTSGGFQVYTKSVESTEASGTGFPALGLSSIGATGERTGTDQLVENNTVGVYVQEQFGWNDRLFLTAAVRADDNSAFGESFDLVYYPKVSASWVVSEEPFWGLDLMSSFRLRAAYGQSGQQPDAFDALRTYVTRIGPDGSATLRPDSPGNAELGPERGVELEVGFDAGMFNDRLSIDLTYYDKRTKDAIVARNVAPSSGFTDEQFVNIGEVSNRGIELGINARLVETQSFDWDTNFNLSTNRNRIEELGIDGFIELGWTTRHVEGYPVGSLFAPDVIEATLDADGVVRNFRCDDGTGQPAECDENAWIYQGHPDPNYEGSLSMTFTLFDRLRIDALAQGKIGQSKYDLQAWWRYAAYQQTELNYFPERFDPTDVAEAQYGNTGEFDLWVNEASFIRFRELSASYSMPPSWLGWVGASQGSISLAARNLGMIWTNWPEWPTHDPEVVDPSATFSGNREPQEDATVPPLTSLVLTLRLTM